MIYSDSPTSSSGRSRLSFYGLQAGGVRWGIGTSSARKRHGHRIYQRDEDPSASRSVLFVRGVLQRTLGLCDSPATPSPGRERGIPCLLGCQRSPAVIASAPLAPVDGSPSYHIDRISELDLWNSFRARIAFHLEEVKRLDPRQELRYCLDKTRKAVRLLRYALSGHTHILAPLVTKADNAERQKSKHLARAQKVYWLALARYRGRPYAGRVTVFVNEELYGTDPTLRWTDLAAGGIEVHSIPGNHSTYITEHVQVVAKELRECLDRAVINNSFGQ